MAALLHATAISYGCNGPVSSRIGLAPIGAEDPVMLVSVPVRSRYIVYPPAGTVNATVGQLPFRQSWVVFQTAKAWYPPGRVNPHDQTLAVTVHGVLKVAPTIHLDTSSQAVAA